MAQKNLNTSHVKVNLQILMKVQQSLRYLNTSHVKVNLIKLKYLKKN